MIMTRDNDFSCKTNESLEIATMSVIGDRKTQEDCFGVKIDEQCAILCVCDGMGGYSGGSVASRIAVKTIIEGFESSCKLDNPSMFLSELTVKANDEVSALHSSIENASNAGSTLVLVFICNKYLYWSAVGDSRLYIWRKGELIQTTKDQNYNTVLNEQLSAGEITEDEFIQGQVRGETLVNYLGIGELNLIDYNKEPLKLKSGDQLIVCTDGLYRILTDEEINNILNVDNNAKSTLQMIEFAVRKKAKEKNMRRDNMTVSLMKVK